MIFSVNRVAVSAAAACPDGYRSAMEEILSRTAPVRYRASCIQSGWIWEPEGSRNLAVVDEDRYMSMLSALLALVRKSGIIAAVKLTGCSKIKAAAFDLDSTLISCEFMNVLAAHCGLSSRMEELTEQAMSGRIGFRDSYLQRLGMIAGISVDTVLELIRNVPFTDGAGRLIRRMSDCGIKTAVITGGYSRLAWHVRRTLGLDSEYSSVLEEKDGSLTGRVIGELLDDVGKVSALKSFCHDYGCMPCDSVVIGDGANDIPMLMAAGTAILYCASPSVAEGFQPIDNVLRLLF